MSELEEYDSRLIDTWFVETKLRPPQSGFKLIERPLLLTVFSSLVEKGSVCVNAPAGFGKTSLLNQWLMEHDRANTSIAWLSLDEDDGELRQFVSYIIFALNQSGIDMGRLYAAAEHILSDIPSKGILPSLVNALSSCNNKIVLILDDFHRVHSRDVNKFVEDLVLLAPEHFRVIICSRTQPEINSASLIAQGRLRELGADALRFSVEDTKQIFNDLLSIENIAALHDRTEGWPVALQFARLAMKEKGMLPAPEANDKGIRDFQISVHSPHIANYFAQQVFEQLSDELQNLLLKTSIVERFDASLADVICENTISYSLMNESLALRPLLIPLDDTERWFRYHHLFGEFLQHRLTQEPQIDVTFLHIRASGWFEQKGQIAEAVRHARLAKDFDRCARLIQDAGGWELILYGGIGYIRTLLRHVSEDDLTKFPRLRIAKAYLCIKDGDIRDATAHLDKVQASGVDVEDKNFDRDKTMIITLLDTYNGETYKQVVNARINRDVEHWPNNDLLGKGVLLCALSISEMGQGRFDNARDLVVQAVRSMRSANSILGINYAYVHLGHIAFLRGKMQMSKAHYVEALSMAEDNFGSDSGLKAVCDVGRTVLSVWQDENREKALCLDKQLATICEGDGWFEIFSIGFSARITQAYLANDSRIAQKTAQQSLKVGEERGDESLKVLSDVFALHSALISKDSAACKRFGSVIRENMKRPLEDEGIHWQFKLEAILAVGLLRLRDSAQYFDSAALDDFIVYLGEISAGLSYLRCLILKASLLQQYGKQAQAHDLIFEAASLAVREHLYTPFLLHSSVRRLVRSSAKVGRERPDQQMETTFLHECILRFPKSVKNKATISLSVRENEVLFELSLGKTNKEIARALDMTHHTVKFHLKNVFVKINADNRIHALNQARRFHLID